jgi:hypothetical protein
MFENEELEPTVEPIVVPIKSNDAVSIAFHCDEWKINGTKTSGFNPRNVMFTPITITKSIWLHDQSGQLMLKVRTPPIWKPSVTISRVHTNAIVIAAMQYHDWISIKLARLLPMIGQRVIDSSFWEPTFSYREPASPDNPPKGDIYLPQEIFPRCLESMRFAVWIGTDWPEVADTELGKTLGKFNLLKKST